jgi:hypothetical protein
MRGCHELLILGLSCCASMSLAFSDDDVVDVFAAMLKRQGLPSLCITPLRGPCPCLDLDGDDAYSEEEFICFAMDHKPYGATMTRSALDLLFMFIDHDKNGYITKPELQLLEKNLGRAPFYDSELHTLFQPFATLNSTAGHLSILFKPHTLGVSPGSGLREPHNLLAEPSADAALSDDPFMLGAVVIILAAVVYRKQRLAPANAASTSPPGAACL